MSFKDCPDNRSENLHFNEGMRENLIIAIAVTGSGFGTLEPVLESDSKYLVLVPNLGFQRSKMKVPEPSPELQEPEHSVPDLVPEFKTSNSRNRKFR